MIISIYILQGEGTRSGVGDCKCNSGYSGALCDACVNKYYEESKNDTNTICNGEMISSFFSCFYLYVILVLYMYTI